MTPEPPPVIVPEKLIFARPAVPSADAVVAPILTSPAEARDMNVSFESLTSPVTLI
jgi:hypothetical protein